VARSTSGKRTGKIAADPRSKAHVAGPHTPDSAPRNAGIRVLGDMSWGTHICIFYETKEDLLDTNASYFRAGLGSNEFCVWAIADPVTEEDAKNSLRREVADFDRRLAAGQIEVLPGHEWYLKGDQFDLKRITGGWSDKLRGALSKGYEGMRVSGNAFWMETSHWKEFCEYEHELDESLAEQKMIAMCTYSLRASRAVDLLDVTRAHQFSVARRNGHWEFLETPELKQARREIEKLHDAMDVLSRPFPGHELLTPRERVVLAQIVTGASSKGAGKTLRISPRTVDSHRSSIMQKLGAKNIADLMRIVLGKNENS
jgi:DNA-binding CsgD family transcriptional regulator